MPLYSEEEIQRRKLRGSLRGESVWFFWLLFSFVSLLDNLQTISRDRSELARGDKESRKKVKELKEKQDDLFTAVTHTREMVLDANANAQLGKIVAEQALNINVALSSDSPAEFAIKVKAWLSRRNDADEAAKWSALGKVAAKHFPLTPGATFLYGPLPTVAVVRQARKPRPTKDKIEAMKKVNELEEEEDPNAVSAATMKQVDNMSEKLESGGELPVWKLITNPESMAQSVEHLFHLSFLVKEGKAGISFDEGQGPMVRPTDPPDAAADNMDRHQAVVKVSMAELQAAQRKFKIEKPTIAHRAPVQQSQMAAPPPLKKARSGSGPSSLTTTPATGKRASVSPAVPATQLLESPAPGSSLTTPMGNKRSKR